MTRDLFLFIPAYNVERELLDLLKSIPSSVLLRTTELLIVNDGSADKTLAVAKKFADEEIRTSVRVESFAKNSGYGAVIKTGLLRAKELAGLLNVKFAVCLHGDGQYPAKSILPMIETLEGSDAVICQGSRHALQGGPREGRMPLYKYLGGKLLTFIENCVFMNKLSDRHSGLIAYRTSYLKKLNLKKLSGSFDIDLEILATADAQEEKLLEIPIETRYAGEVSNLRVIPYGFRVLRVALRRLRGFYG